MTSALWFSLRQVLCQGVHLSGSLDANALLGRLWVHFGEPKRRKSSGHQAATPVKTKKAGSDCNIISLLGGENAVGWLTHCDFKCDMAKTSTMHFHGNYERSCGWCQEQNLVRGIMFTSVAISARQQNRRECLEWRRIQPARIKMIDSNSTPKLFSAFPMSDHCHPHGFDKRIPFTSRFITAIFCVSQYLPSWWVTHMVRE